MKVKALKTCSTVTPELFWKANQIRDIPEHQANELLNSRDFELVEPKSEQRRKEIQTNSLKSKKYVPSKKK